MKFSNQLHQCECVRSIMTYADGTVVSNAYTGRNQISSIRVDGPPPLVSYTYDLNGNRITKSLENGTSVTNGYDNAHRITMLNHLSNGISFARFDYGYDSVNRRKFVKRDSSLGDAFVYDAVDQVTNVLYNATNPDTTPSSPSSTTGYGLDAVGNRTAVTVTTTNSVSTSYIRSGVSPRIRGQNQGSVRVTLSLIDRAGWYRRFGCRESPGLNMRVRFIM